jgi:putative transposase
MEGESMPRQARFLEPKLPYHVTQRGNYGQDVFRSDEDRFKYLELMERYANKYKLEVWAYCLMSNHVHFIVYPHEHTSLARTMATAHMVYSQHLHRAHGLVGHLWQGRFFSCALDERHLLSAVRYVELNPVRAKMVKAAGEWPWSSARHHLGLQEDTLLAHADWPDDNLMKDWGALLELEDSDEAIERLRHATRTGRPLGSDSWIARLEQKTGRRLRALPHGRPRKVDSDEDRD